MQASPSKLHPPQILLFWVLCKTLLRWIRKLFTGVCTDLCLLFRKLSKAMQDKWPKGRVLLAIEGNRAFRPIFGVLGVVWQKLRGGFPVFVRALSYVANMSAHREHGTGCRHSWSCCGRPLLIYFSSVCLWKPGNRLIIVVWCALKLPLGSQ